MYTLFTASMHGRAHDVGNEATHAAVADGATWCQYGRQTDPFNDRRTAMQYEVDINDGSDFERAYERLSHIAGKRFQQYREAKQSRASEEAIARLRQAYVDAQREQYALSPHDDGAINAVLIAPF
jgi:hypothetical protein